MDRMNTLIIVLIAMFAGVCLGEVSAGSLIQDVQDAPYDVESYELGRFDCSQMSVIMERHLTERGYDARIQTYILRPGYGHAIVVVYDQTQNRSYKVESTWKEVIEDLPSEYVLVGEYDDILDAVENGVWGVSEWGEDLYFEEKNKRRNGR